MRTTHRFTIINLRAHDAAPLIAIEDSPANAVREQVALNAVLAKVRDLNPLDRRQALGELTLSGILKLESVLRNRLREADMTIDLRENELVGPYIIEAEKLGEQTGQRKTVTKQLKAGFGTLSVWARKRLEQASPKEMDRWQLRILTASALEKCLTRPSKPRGVDLR